MKLKSKWRSMPGITITLAGLLSPCAARAIEIECPSRIHMQPIVVTDVPQGWRASQTTHSLPIWSASIFVGEPEKRGLLKPEIDSIKGQKTFNWTFTPDENKQGLWLSCSYGNAPAHLVQPLPKGISHCTAHEPVLKTGEWKLVTVCR